MSAVEMSLYLLGMDRDLLAVDLQIRVIIIIIIIIIIITIIITIIIIMKLILKILLDYIRYKQLNG